MKNNALKGSILVAIGASSYGMLATFVKMAYHEGFSTAEVTISQFSIGVVGLLILTLFSKRTPQPPVGTARTKGIAKLLVAGTSMGLTSIFYYKAVQYIPVNVGIVLLMQSVWMGVVLEMLLHRRAPGLRKIIAVIIILGGTVLATNMISHPGGIHWRGFGWGMLAALSYTGTMYASDKVGLDFPPLKRSLYMVLGGFIVVLLVYYSVLNPTFSFGIFLRWGLLLSVFGTILPPLLFMRGMPLTGMGLGAIIASVEIPVSVLMAYIVLQEPVGPVQWLGVVLILLAVVLMNLRKRESVPVIE